MIHYSRSGNLETKNLKLAALLSHPHISCMVGPPRHFCRNPRCRMKLPAPVDNHHRAFCCSGCHSSFYRSRCLVCEEPMRRKTERQMFGSGHAVCQAEYKRWQHVYNYAGYHPTRNVRSSSKTRVNSPSKPLIGPSDFPINLLGGYRHPNAPALDPELRKAILVTETGCGNRR
jgi:hypothetical protein